MSPLKINYPKGQGLSPKFNKKAKQKIKKKTFSYANRGMSLEEDINKTNKQYLLKNQAVIHKKPTPIQVVKVDYPKRSAAKITEAYYRRSSTTDYNGLYRGFYLDFEAKESKNKKSFPLNNFHEHQIKHMKKINEHGGIAFAIILFSSLNKIYLLEADFLFKWWDQQFNEKGRKSIPIKEIEKENNQIPYAYNPRIPYLDLIDKIIDQK